MAQQTPLSPYLKAQTRILLPPRSLHGMRALGPEPVHKLRVTTRRIRAALWVLRHSPAHIRFKELDQDLHRLLKCLGKVRELDVAIDDMSKRRLDPDPCIMRRKAAWKNLHSLLGQKEKKKLARQLFAAGKATQTLNPALLREAADHLRQRLKKQLKQSAHGPKKLHQLRIAAKKARYALEAMGKPVPEEMKRLQHFLGRAHDLEFLQTLTGKHARRIKAEQRKLNGQAACLIQPALRQAIAALEHERAAKAARI